VVGQLNSVDRRNFSGVVPYTKVNTIVYENAQHTPQNTQQDGIGFSNGNKIVEYSNGNAIEDTNFKSNFIKKDYFFNIEEIVELI